MRLNHQCDLLGLTHLAALARLLPLPPHGIPSRVPIRHKQHPLPLANSFRLLPPKHLPPRIRQPLDLCWRDEIRHGARRVFRSACHDVLL